MLTVNHHRFEKDGKPWQIMSGAMHYFRIPRAYWYDRLLKLRECGLNTVETYTCWNLHEPKEGTFCFDGNLDLGAYIDTAASLGLDVIVRPGPYICAEWDNGGVPAWLLAEDGVVFRSREERWLTRAEAYLTRLCDILVPRLQSHGGNVALVQVENEYGSYGDDKVYLAALRDLYRRCGVDCELFTSDAPLASYIEAGNVGGVRAVGNFNGGVQDALACLKEVRPQDPLMCGEYWCGWFDHWGEQHHRKSVSSTVDDITAILRAGGSFNLYMFCGGTNFGFMSGANEANGLFQADVTSYDYDAPLSEAGDRTPLYDALQKLLCDYRGIPVTRTATETPKAAYGAVKMVKAASLWQSLDALGKATETAAPVCMEKLGQSYGYILYSTVLTGPLDAARLHLDGLRDRALLYLDGKRVGEYDDYSPMTEDRFVSVTLGAGQTARLDILVENMGRVNFGPGAFDRKGLRAVRLGDRYHYGFTVRPLPMDDLSRVPFGKDFPTDAPAFYRGTLTVQGEPRDTFVRLDGFQKGFVTVNGFHLGRYFNTSCPQKTLYVPASVLHEGDNDVTVFESDGTEKDEIIFTDKHDIG